jgi:hypothetical protein
MALKEGDAAIYAASTEMRRFDCGSIAGAARRGGRRGAIDGRESAPGGRLVWVVQSKR